MQSDSLGGVVMIGVRVVGPGSVKSVRPVGVDDCVIGQLGVVAFAASVAARAADAANDV
jgi:hypothetical protein